MIRARLDRSARSRARSLLAVLGPAAMVAVTVVPAHPAAAGVAPAAAARPAAVAGTVVAAAPVTAAPTASQHTVAPGETLSHVATRYGTSVAALAAANGLADPDLVLVGAVLSVPSSAAPAASAGPSGGGGGGSGSGAGLPARLQASPTRLSYVPIFERWAAANGIPADLLMAMTWLESGWQNHLVSSTGAVGIGQLMPDTVDHVEALIGVDLDPSVVDDNIRMSARFLRWLLARSGSVEAALAGYYQGPASVARIGLLDETRTYIANVVALRGRF